MNKPKEPKPKDNGTPNKDATKGAESATKPKVEVRKKSATLSLPVKLTKDEIVKRTDSLLGLLDHLDSAEEDAKAARDRHKSIIQGFEADIARARASLRTNTEKRPIKCDQHFDHKKQTVTVFRSDTNARVHERAMLPSEKQKNLDEAIKDAKNKKKTEAKKGNILPMTAPTGK